MISWKIPAKTFLIGEYIALEGGPAIVLTTNPCFELSLVNEPVPPVFHPDSPAGQFCQRYLSTSHFNWHDPYHGLGGLGASSAQFVGCYYAFCYLSQRDFSSTALLQEYWKVAWNGEGQRPSGYDVLAQTYSGCVLINYNEDQIKSMAWPFEKIGFLLVHTQHKLATHEYLRQVDIRSAEMSGLYTISAFAWQAFEQKNDVDFIQAVNAYQAELNELEWVAPMTQKVIERLRSEVSPLAIKGCGALGADVVLLLVESLRVDSVADTLEQSGYTILATSSGFNVIPQ